MQRNQAPYLPQTASTSRRSVTRPSSGQRPKLNSWSPAAAYDSYSQAVATDCATSIKCLEQLTHSYRSIVGCDAWHQLLQLLPQLLTADPNPNSCTCGTKHHSNPAADSAVHSSQLQDSSEYSVTAAAERLLLHKLAPEVLDCSPEPLAELLLALLTASSNQNCCVGSAPSAASPAPPEAPAPEEAAAGAHALPTAHTQHHPDYSSNVAGSVSPSCVSPSGARIYTCQTVQLIVVGLHKIARQWHFLDEQVSQQLSNAVDRLLLEPLQLLLTVLMSNSSDASHCQVCPLQSGQTDNPHSQLSQESTPPEHLQQQIQCQTFGAVEYSCHSHEQQKHEQQPKCSFCCCLAEQLVIADPAMCWLHRMNACSTSGRMLRRAMTTCGLVEHLRQWLTSVPVSEGGQSSLVLAHRAIAALAQDSFPTGSGCDNWWATAANSMSSHCTDGLMSVNSMPRVHVAQQHMQHCLCVVYQLLSTLMETPTGRKLLAASQRDLAKLSAWQQHHSATADEGSKTASHPNRPEKSSIAVQKAGELGDVALSAAFATLGCLARQAVPNGCQDAALLAAAESASLALDAFLQAPGEGAGLW